MIHDLDHEAALDPSRVGAKAAWLAMARRAGLPVLPGLIVDTADSLACMRLGAEMLANRGSGGARLAMTAEPVPFADELVQRGARLGNALVARSSTIIESSGEWSGAFTSYLDLSPTDLPKAVTGCWASAFSVAALERQEAAGIEPGSVSMAVLVQTALDPVAGGTAVVDPGGPVVITGVKGSPAPLLQGWSNGLQARSDGGEWEGEELVAMLGSEALDEIAAVMREASDRLGANRAEWALDGQIWMLQLARDPLRTPISLPRPEWADPHLVPVARAVIKAGGRLGDELILPWALGGLPEPGPPIEGVPVDAMASALELRDELTAEVWGLPAQAALAEARSWMRMLLGTDPRSAANVMSSLGSPDPSTAASLLGLVEGMERDDPSPRRGVGRWEPFVAAVVLSAGTTHEGTAASAGFGAGIVHRGQTAFLPRSVIAAPKPVPNLAPLLWDAAAIVTETGSPAAHLFESARALRVPAVCGVAIPSGEQIVAVDGHNGVVATIPLQDHPDV